MECVPLSDAYLNFSPNYYYVILTIWLSTVLVAFGGFSRVLTEYEAHTQTNEARFEAIRDILLSVHGELRSIRDATQRLRLRKRSTTTSAIEEAHETHSEQE
jgi:hypothetical protein